jgi:hypothetical protein
MRIRVILAAGIAALATGLVAAFGPRSSAAPASLGAGAAVAPADAAAFVAIDSDLGSSQWSSLDSLLAKVGVLSRLRQGLQQKTGIRWNDLQAALGPELDIVVLPGAGKPQLVLLTQPGDTAAFDALLNKAGPAAVSARVDGWTAVSDSQAALEAVTGAAQHLADDSLYRQATAKLSGDSLAQVYANGAEAGSLASALGVEVVSRHLVWVAAGLAATEGGLRVDGAVGGDGTGAAPQPYTSQLVDRIPSGALLVADFQARQGEGTPAESSNPLAAALGRLGAALGGETALYLTPALPFPAITLVTQAADPQAVLDALNQTLGAAGPLSGLLRGLDLSHELVGNDLVVSTSRAAIDAYRGGGAKLSSDALFQEAQSVAGMPAQTTGFVYVNLKDALPYLRSMLGGSGPLNLGALRTLLAYGTGSTNDESRFTAFLEVR